MYEFHKDKRWYFDMQTLNAEKYVIPFIEEVLPIRPDLSVLEVGCGEGGVLKAFVKKGCKGVGVDINPARIDLARQFLKEDNFKGDISFYSENIYHVRFESLFLHQFDLIVLKDVIEHIHNQEDIMCQFKKYLKPEGYIFLGFPPFNMPYGGHQQIAENKIFSKLPWTHLLPVPLYRFLMKCFHTDPDQFLEIKETGISTKKFERISVGLNYTIAYKRFFLINPIYEYKFGIRPRIQFRWITAWPFLRDFVTTCAYYLIRK